MYHRTWLRCCIGMDDQTETPKTAWLVAENGLQGLHWFSFPIVNLWIKACLWVAMGVPIHPRLHFVF